MRDASAASCHAAERNISLEVVARLAVEQSNLDFTRLGCWDILRDHLRQLGLQLIEQIGRQLDAIVNQHRQQPIAGDIGASLALAPKKRINKAHEYPPVMRFEALMRPNDLALLTLARSWPTAKHAKEAIQHPRLLLERHKRHLLAVKPPCNIGKCAPGLRTAIEHRHLAAVG